MLSLPQRYGTKTGAVLYGLVAGISAVVIIVFGAFFIGVFASWIPVLWAWDQTGEYSAWAPLIFAEYSVLPALAVGAVVAWWIWRSRLRSGK
jgi:hypothetical protein